MKKLKKTQLLKTVIIEKKNKKQTQLLKYGK